MAELRRSPRLKEKAQRRVDAPDTPNKKAASKVGATAENTFSAGCVANYLLGFLPHLCIVGAVAYIGLLMYAIITPSVVPQTPFLTEMSYGEECSLTYDNIMGRVDIFVFSHWVGWAVQVFMWQNFQMVFLMSVQFEMVELSFAHWLPNFIECWWDSVLFDTLGFNLLGTLIGIWLFKKLGMKQLDWFGVGFGEVKKKQKKGSAGFRRTFVCVAMLFVNSLGQATGFFLKRMFSLPSNHPFFAMHMASFGVLAVTSAPSFYNYLYPTEHKRKPNHQLRVCCAFAFFTILFVETLLILLHGGRMMAVATPSWVPIFWLFQAAAVSACMAVRSYNGVTALIVCTIVISACGCAYNTMKF